MLCLQNLRIVIIIKEKLQYVKQRIQIQQRILKFLSKKLFIMIWKRHLRVKCLYPNILIMIIHRSFRAFRGRLNTLIRSGMQFQRQLHLAPQLI